MNLLLDTHTFLWYIGNDPQLSVNAQALINDANNDIFLSVGSLWEIAIKLSLGKLSLTQPFETFIPQQLGINSISLLSITVDHAVKVSALPFHHRDPFDRLLVAQALVSDMPIVGADAVFDAYGVRRLW